MNIVNTGSRNRHAAGSWLDRAILSNRQIAYRATNANGKPPAGALDLGQSIHFFLHGSKHRHSPGHPEWLSHGVILPDVYRDTEANDIDVGHFAEADMA